MPSRQESSLPVNECTVLLADDCELETRSRRCQMWAILETIRQSKHESGPECSDVFQ